MNGEEILRVNKVNLTIGDTCLIDDKNSVPFVVKKGEVVLLMGQNGSGKTTLIETIFSMADPMRTQGRLTETPYFCGKPIDLSEIRSQIGYSENEIGFEFNHNSFEKTLCSLTKEYIKGLDYEYLEELFATFRCNNKDSKRFLGIKYESSLRRRAIGKCSGGQKKKFSLIKALARKDAPLYVFDEPVNCLDVGSMKAFCDFIETHRGKGSAFLIITHCRIFKTPDRVYEISKKTLHDVSEKYKATNCLETLIDHNND